MDTQPKSHAPAHRNEQNATILQNLLADSEPVLRRQAGRHIGADLDADDALQSAYALFIERYRGNGDPLAWLQTTVKREAWAISRRASRWSERCVDRDLTELLADDAPTPEAHVIRTEQIAERREALAALKHDERRALWLFGAGLSYAEICEACKWSSTKVNRCIAEGRAALQGGQRVK